MVACDANGQHPSETVTRGSLARRPRPADVGAAPAWARSCMNASCIDCLAPPASRLSTAAVSARTTSSTSSAVMPDRRRGDRAPARTAPVRRGDAPNSARHLAARDATSRKCRIQNRWVPTPFLQTKGCGFGGHGPVMRWGIQPVANATPGYRRTELKKCLAGPDRAARWP